MIKKIFAAGLAALVMMGAAGCNMVFLNEERDKQTVVATVNGEDILKPTVMQLYNSYKSMYGITDENEKSEAAAEAVKTLKDSLLDAAVNDVLSRQKAKELGVDLTEEEQKAIDQEMDEVLANIQTRAESYADAAIAADSTIDRDAYIAKEKEYMLESYGINDGSYRKNLESQKLLEKLQEHLLNGYTPTDEEIQAWYDKNLESQKKEVEETPTSFAKYEDEGIALYLPAGFRFVRDILISFDEETKTKIKELRDQDKDDEADAMRDEALKAIEGKANEAYEKATAPGADFSAVLAEYTDDAGMKAEPSKDTGYRIYKDSKAYNETLIKTGMALGKVGDISKPAASDNGYYIIEYTSDMQSGQVALEDVKESVQTKMIADKKDELYQEALKKWTEESQIAKYNDRLNY